MNTRFTSVRRTWFNAVALSALAIGAIVVVAVLVLPLFSGQSTNESAATAPITAIAEASHVQRLYGLNEQFYPSGAVVRAQSTATQRLYTLEQIP